MVECHVPMQLVFSSVPRCCQCFLCVSPHPLQTAVSMASAFIHLHRARFLFHMTMQDQAHACIPTLLFSHSHTTSQVYDVVQEVAAAYERHRVLITADECNRLLDAVILPPGTPGPYGAT